MQIVKNRKIFFAISIILILCGFAAMAINHFRGIGAFNYDVQFTGGVSVQATLGTDVTNADVEAVIQEATGAAASQLQFAPIEGGNSAIIKFRELDSEKTEALKTAMIEKFSITEDDFTVQSVSATISSEMVRDSIIAVVVACGAMLIYVSFRFRDFKKGSSAIIALLQDALVVVGSYAIFRIPLNSNFIVALLTILGYSINSTIVIFDRVRENTRSVGRKNYEALVNLSVKQTMTRSLFTSLTTFFTVACLYIFGVSAIKEFALPIGVGIVCGTFSSVCLSGNIWYTLCTRGKKK